MSIALAFSGGLDTSFCVPYLRETYEEPVYTVTVDTGGTDSKEVLEARSKELGAERHIHLDAKSDLFNDYLLYLIAGNVLRGGVYPLCVGAERVIQAAGVVNVAKELGARAIAHGCTGAGNDQVRFDVVARMAAEGLDIITPIRDHGFSRQYTTQFLRKRGIEVQTKTTKYSVNTGLWGTTIGGAETLGTRLPLPDEAYPHTCSPAQAPEEPQTFVIRFRGARPEALDGVSMEPVDLIENLNEIGARYGVGRNIHIGDTILGLKGRVAFEAPAALTLITAHRELEKVVLTKWQQYQKNQLADLYGMLLHEGQYHDPVMRDIEAFFDSSQTSVVGDVTVQFDHGHVKVLGIESPYSMFDEAVATYGETSALWDGQDARSFCKFAALQSQLSHKARVART